MTSLQVNSEVSIPFGYDDDGLLMHAGHLAMTRDPGNGILLGSTLVDGDDVIEGAFTHNSFGEIQSYTTEFNNSEIYSSSIGSRDKLGRITERTETITIAPGPPQSTTRNFRYDSAGRLWKVCADGPCSSILSEYLYDQNGNRNDGFVGADAISAIYDDQDRLLSNTRGSVTHLYTYNENGDLASKAHTGANAITTYSHDAFGNLRSVTLPDETTIDYLIDGRSRRIGKKVNGTVVQRFVYKDQLNPVAEIDGDGAVVAQFIYASKPNVPDYMIKGGRTYGVASDHLGSVKLLIDIADGSVAQHIDYDEFGQVTIDTNPGFQPFGFAGGIYDRDTGLMHFGARDYDPSVGRWIAKDAIGFAGKDTNFYGYVQSDPINFIDPTGFQRAPGYNYCGAGNNPDSEPVNDLDRACQEHDECYGRDGMSANDVTGQRGQGNDDCPQDRCDDKLCDAAREFSPETRYDSLVTEIVDRMFCDPSAPLPPSPQTLSLPYF